MSSLAQVVNLLLVLGVFSLSLGGLRHLMDQNGRKATSNNP